MIQQMKQTKPETSLQIFRPIRKTKVALKGIYLALRSDFSVAYKVVLAVILMSGFFYFRQWVDFSLVLLATAFVVFAETFNTAIEELCDFIEPNENVKIGQIKDVAAGAVGISIAVWFIIILIEIYRAYQLFQD